MSRRHSPRSRSPLRFIDQATQDKLLRAQALLRHRMPSGDLAAIRARALDALLEDLERERFAATKTPRAPRARTPTSDPRRVPHDVQRAVHTRDGEQCTFVSEDGRCNEHGFLERDHVTPVALGGQPTTDGIRTLCKRHNAYEAERILGAEVVAAGRRRRARTKAPTPAEAPTVAARPTPERVPRADAAAAATALDADTFRARRLRCAPRRNHRAYVLAGLLTCTSRRRSRAAGVRPSVLADVHVSLDALMNHAGYPKSRRAAA